MSDWDKHFLDVARLVALRSKDPSTKTGCVITQDNRIVATGYNGFPQGVTDNPERYADRELKYRLIVHCDTNAIYQAARSSVSLLGATMYLTGPPCNECSKGIIQSGIIRVVWPADNPFENDPATMARWKDSIDASFLMLREASVKTTRV